MTPQKQVSLIRLILLTIIVHTVTYTIIGFLAFIIFNYAETFSKGPLQCFMRPTSDPLVMAGPLFQPIRGLIFAFAFYPIRVPLFEKRFGWLVLWWLLVALGILSTFGPAPASLEGMVYTIVPTSLTSYAEVVPQAFLLSAILYYWVKHPGIKWINWVMGVLFALTILMPLAGLLMRPGIR